jgi:hypothetical protein
MTKHKEVEKWVAGMAPTSDPYDVRLQTVRTTFIETPTEFRVKEDNGGPGSAWRAAIRLCNNHGGCFRKNSDFDMAMLHETQWGSVQAFRLHLIQAKINAEARLRDVECRLDNLDSQMKEQGYPQ